MGSRFGVLVVILPRRARTLATSLPVNIRVIRANPGYGPSNEAASAIVPYSRPMFYIDVQKDYEIEMYGSSMTEYRNSYNGPNMYFCKCCVGKKGARISCRREQQAIMLSSDYNDGA